MAVCKTSSSKLPEGGGGGGVKEPVPRLISAFQPLISSLCSIHGSSSSKNNNVNVNNNIILTATSTTTATSTNNPPHQFLVSSSSSSFGSPSTINLNIHGWLQSMRDLSPPHSRCCHPSIHHESSSSSSDDQEQLYIRWTLQHPSALDRFDKLIGTANGKQIAIFLDYDGTLSPIVEDPERAVMTDEMRAAVKDIATLFPTSIITGRSREKVFQFVQLAELYYAGSHGMDIMGPAESCNGLQTNGTRVVDENGKEIVLFQPASEFTSIMDEVFNLLQERTRQISGAKVEHNKFCISVHFRRVKEENWLMLAQQVQFVLNSYPNLRLTHGRKILEIRPSIAWNKGKALDYLMQTLGLGNPNSIFPIYIGDDQTDEDAFKVITGYKHGLSILVSRVAKKTDAICSLRDPKEVLQFLQHLVQWQRRRMSKSECM